MIDDSYLRYWTIVTAYRRGSKTALGTLKLLGTYDTKEGRIAQKFCDEVIG